MVIIRTYDTYVEARIALGRLEAGGIQAFLHDEHSITIDPFLTNAIGGIKLVVHARDAAEADRLLNDVEGTGEDGDF